MKIEKAEMIAPLSSLGSWWSNTAKYYTTEVHGTKATRKRWYAAYRWSDSSCRVCKVKGQHED